MEIIEADDDTADAAKAAICAQMSRALIEAKADLASETAVKAALMAAGFGRMSIDALWIRAARGAQGKPPAHFS